MFSATTCTAPGVVSRRTLGASSRLGFSAWPALAAARRGRRLPLLLLLADVAVAVFSGIVELATNRDRLASRQRLLIIDGLELPSPSQSSRSRCQASLDGDLELQVLWRRTA
jgi:hypothetical protein